MNEVVKEEKEYVELTKTYDPDFVKQQVESDKDQTNATYACIQNISNLMKKITY